MFTKATWLYGRLSLLRHVRQAPGRSDLARLATQFTAPIDARAWGEISAVALAAIIIVELEKRWLAAKPSQC